MRDDQSVLVVGSANQDIVVEVPRQPAFGETILGTGMRYVAGGKGLNQACASASADASTYFVGCVGSDEAGEQLLRALHEGGADSSLTVTSTDASSGTAHILVDSAGSNQIVVVPAANYEVSEGQVRTAFEEVPGATVLVLQSEIRMEISQFAAELMAERGGRTVLNLAPAMQVPADFLRLSDPLVVNEFEAGIVLGVDAPKTPDEAVALVPQMLDLAKSVVITLGKNGAVVADQSGVWTIPEHPVDKVVDTTGAGDAFVGVLAAELARGASLLEAAKRANVAAGESVTRPGASASYGAIRALY